MTSSDKWFPEDYSPNISTERWLELLGDKEVAKEESLIVLKCLKDFGGEATCKQLSEKYGRHAQFYNLASSRLAKRVAQNTGCPVLERDNANSKWWPVLYLGRYAEDARNGVYIWKLRPELSAALEQYNLDTIPLYAANEKKNEYQLAAVMLMEIAEEQGIDTAAIAEEAEKQRLAFVERFAPEKLLAIPDDQLLRTIYYANQDNSDTLCRNIEFVVKVWGSIRGGGANKFGMFQDKNNQWKNIGFNIVSEDEALQYAKNIRERLVKGAKIIESLTIASREDAEKLDQEIEALFKGNTNMWVHKYYALLFPDKLSCFHSAEWRNHVLYSCGIIPSEKLYARSAQIAMIANHAGWHYPAFWKVFTSRFGDTPKKFYRLGSEIGGESNIEQWKQKSAVAIGWPAVGSLKGTDGKVIERSELVQKLQAEYYHDKKSVASRKAGELTVFYNTDESSVFVVMSGETPLALVDNLKEYIYQDDSLMPHFKHGDWHECFEEDERLPDKSEGLRTSCVEFKDQNNLLYLYHKYYELDDMELEQPVALEPEDSSMEISQPKHALNFQLHFPSPFEKNRIIFGAPGTGKSYHLKKEAEELCEGDSERIERVTFHPDYAYSHFMGCYKPQTTPNGGVRYGFVPGPFLRVLVKALRSGMDGEVKPHLLLIEEINRARVAAVFGDAFQLLDRVDDEYSEYDIAVSEDIKAYLSEELGCSPDECERIRIPGNMFIWATMNSADQGVFPMDTAFKRRWTFEYLPIDPEMPPDAHIPLIHGGQEKDISWKTLRGAINDRLSAMRINEDKLIGPYFLKPSVLRCDDSKKIQDAEAFKKLFKNKILMYLFEDAARQRRQELFKGCTDCHRYSTLCRAFDERGLDIFGEDFIKLSAEKQA